MPTTVTVITPCHNGEPFIARCAESLLCQDYPCIEWVFVDDDSSDHSKDLFWLYEQRLAEAGIQLKYILQSRGGPAVAVRTGLSAVSGDYVSVLDVDDEFLPKSVARRAAMLDECPDLDIVFSNGYAVYPDGRRSLFSTSPKPMDHMFDRLVVGSQYNWAGSYMVRVAPLLAFYRQHEFHATASEAHLQLLMPLAYSGKTGYIHEPLMVYHRRVDSLSQVWGAYERRLEAVSDYEAIRRSVIREVVPKGDRERYEQLVDNLYHRARLELARRHRRRADAQREYQALLSRGAVLRRDRLVYYSSQCAAFDGAYRFLLYCYVRIRGWRSPSHGTIR